MQATNIKRAYLMGDTYSFRGVLKQHGWRWDGTEKVWYKDGEWVDEEGVVRAVRLYAGIRNRGQFRATLHTI